MDTFRITPINGWRIAFSVDGWSAYRNDVEATLAKHRERLRGNVAQIESLALLPAQCGAETLDVIELKLEYPVGLRQALESALNSLTLAHTEEGTRKVASLLFDAAAGAEQKQAVAI